MRGALPLNLPARVFNPFPALEMRLVTCMKYLFFDIECSVVSKKAAKICAFGYCLTDEQFHILEKEDILINPQGGFHLTDRRGEQGLVLPYEYAKFKKYPTFPEKAEKIYSLLQDSDTLVVGHASMNDVKYLNLESRRFSLPSFAFEFADTQFLYMNKIGEFSRQFGLGAIAESLGVEFVAHRAVDDAYATMKVAEAMCKEAGCSLSELLARYQITLGRIRNYEITQTTSAPFVEYKLEQEKRKEEREKRKIEFYRFADREKRKRSKTGSLQGKRLCFSHSLILQTEQAKALLAAAYRAAGAYTSHAEECDMYIAVEHENGARAQSVLKAGGRVLQVEEFQALLGE